MGSHAPPLQGNICAMPAAWDPLGPRNRTAPGVLITALAVYDGLQIVLSPHPGLIFFPWQKPAAHSDSCLYRMSQGIPEKRWDVVRESHSLEERPWGNSGRKDLTFIELVLGSRHFAQISSLSGGVGVSGNRALGLWGQDLALPGASYLTSPAWAAQ